MNFINASLKYKKLLQMEVRHRYLLHFVISTIVLASCAGVPKNTEIVAPSPQILITNAMEKGEVEEVARICLEESIYDGDNQKICDMVFQDELKQDTELRTKWLAKNSGDYGDHRLAVELLNIWLQSEHRINQLPTRLRMRLHNTEIGKKVMNIIEEDEISPPTVNNQDAEDLYKFQNELLDKHRAGQVISETEIKRLIRLFHKVFKDDISTYKAVYETKPSVRSKRSTAGWILVITAIFDDDPATIKALNNYLKTE